MFGLTCYRQTGQKTGFSRPLPNAKSLNILTWIYSDLDCLDNEISFKHGLESWHCQV